ncbi:pyridoxamine 5'-phosphate oxidase family protein [Cohnella panacarvi]|uniref:pyridoxamine 5'-phosphate oxidase family protein n=1 Tax=Cohnella panacarvi TaxID=400776 RepID=UPI00047D08C3|nr:pyridoxamine 5'-phosphate oxidase family protein [Cohnella panacarvi]
MFTVRLAKRECTDMSKIEYFLKRAQTGFLGMSLGNRPYVVPMNYTWWNGAIYVHGAEEGRRAQCLRANANVCFTIGEYYGTITSPIPAHTDTAYMSVVIDGRASFVTDIAEATEAMQSMLDKYVPGFYDQPLASSHVEKYRSSLGSKTAIMKIDPIAIVAKENAPVQEKMFHPGMKNR